MELAAGWQRGLGGVVAGALAWALALLVLLLRPDRPANRALALLLAFDGTVVAAGFGLARFTDDLATSFALQALAFLAYLMIAPCELALLGTLPTPLARPFSRPAARRLLAAVALVELVAFFLWQDLFIVLAPPAYGPGVASAALFALSTLVHLYALAVALHALRAAATPEARRRARAFAAAFGFRNAGFVVVIAGTFAPRYGDAINAYGFPLVTALFVLAAAYAILATQLFDIDLRIKRTISRGSVLASFAGVFVVVGVIAENYLSERYGYLVGGAAAGLLLLAIAPLRRAGERLANAAMPHVHETPAYVAYRKMEVYRAALEGALQDGEVTPKEREMLRRLREHLALRSADAEALEAQLRERAA